MELYTKLIVMLLTFITIFISTKLNIICEDYCIEITRRNDYYKFQRTEKEFNVQLIITKTDIEIVNSTVALKKFAKEELKNILNLFNTNKSNDAKFFIEKLTYLISDKNGDSFILMQIPKINAIAIKCDNYSPSYIFYLKEDVKISTKDFEVNLRLFYDKIIDKEDTCYDTKRTVAIMTLLNCFQYMFVLFTFNSILFYMNDDIKMIIYVREHEMNYYYKNNHFLNKMIVPLKLSSFKLFFIDNLIKIQTSSRKYSISYTFKINGNNDVIKENMLKNCKKKQQFINCIKENIKKIYQEEVFVESLQALPQFNDNSVINDAYEYFNHYISRVTEI